MTYNIQKLAMLEEIGEIDALMPDDVVDVEDSFFDSSPGLMVYDGIRNNNLRFIVQVTPGMIHGKETSKENIYLNDELRLEFRNKSKVKKIEYLDIDNNPEFEKAKQTLIRANRWEN